MSGEGRARRWRWTADSGQRASPPPGKKKKKQEQDTSPPPHPKKKAGQDVLQCEATKKNAPAVMILTPVGTEPVKEILSMSGWLASAPPTSGPPVRMLRTPAGTLSGLGV